MISYTYDIVYEILYLIYYHNLLYHIIEQQLLLEQTMISYVNI